MVEQLDYTELNSLVKHFLEFNGLKESAQVFEHEIRNKVLQNQAKAAEEAKVNQNRGSAEEEPELLNVLKVNRIPQTEQ